MSWEGNYLALRNYAASRHPGKNKTGPFIAAANYTENRPSRV